MVVKKTKTLIDTRSKFKKLSDFLWIALKKTYMEIALAIVFLTGWLLVTAAIAALTTPWVWSFSLGTMCLGLCGFKYLYTILREGLYKLIASPSIPKR